MAFCFLIIGANLVKKQEYLQLSVVSLEGNYFVLLSGNHTLGLFLGVDITNKQAF